MTVDESGTSYLCFLCFLGQNTAAKVSLIQAAIFTKKQRGGQVFSYTNIQHYL